MSAHGIRPVSGAPLLVAAPTTRCGTTLVQRLLNSSENALVFGEGVFAALRALAALAREQLDEHGARSAQQRVDLARALRGEQFWCPHLMPDVAGYLDAWRGALDGLVRFHEREARALGRPLWGAKHPKVSAEELELLRELIPGARIVYVTRDVFAVIRSAKARRFLRTLPEVGDYARRWAENVLGARTAFRDAPGVFFLRHEDLERNRTEALARLAAFTGARGMRAEVLDVRVNTWSGTREGQAPDQYVAPLELSGEERSAIERAAGEAIAVQAALGAVAA